MTGNLQPEPKKTELTKYSQPQSTSELTFYYYCGSSIFRDSFSQIIEIY